VFFGYSYFHEFCLLRLFKSGLPRKLNFPALPQRYADPLQLAAFFNISYDLPGISGDLCPAVAG
jgi:hypothetical protein